MSTRKRPSPCSDDDYGPNQHQKTTKAARTTRGATRKQKTAEELLSEPKNNIFDPKTDLLALLSTPEARKAIEELRPDLVEHHRRLLNDTGLARRCIANFQRDGRSGFYDPEWQSQAREAFERHRNGDFDGYLQWRLYQDWPELEESDKAREKAAAEAHAVKMAEEEKKEQDEEQRGREAESIEAHTTAEVRDAVGEDAQCGSQTPTAVPTSAQESISVEEQGQHGDQVPSEVRDSAEASNIVEEENETGIPAPLEVQSEVEASKSVELHDQQPAQTPPKVPTQHEDRKSPEVPHQDPEPHLLNIQTPPETQEPTQIQETPQQYDFQASKESTERLPTTPPREHSPDVQCIFDSQEPHSSSPPLAIEDIPKPLPLPNDIPPGSSSLFQERVVS